MIQKLSVIIAFVVALVDSVVVEELVLVLKVAAVVVYLLINFKRDRFKSGNK